MSSTSRVMYSLGIFGSCRWKMFLRPVKMTRSDGLEPVRLAFETTRNSIRPVRSSTTAGRSLFGAGACGASDDAADHMSVCSFAVASDHIAVRTSLVMFSCSTGSMLTPPAASLMSAPGSAISGLGATCSVCLSPSSDASLASSIASSGPVR